MASSYDLSLFQTTLSGADIIPSATMGMAYFTIASGKTSSLYFGGLNPTYATSSSQLSWVPLYSSTTAWWQVSVTGIWVGQTSISIVANNGIVDSGTSFILMTNTDYTTWQN